MNAIGLVYAEIELINSEELAMARRHIIGEEEVKRITIKMLADTGAYNLCTNETKVIYSAPNYKINIF